VSESPIPRLDLAPKLDRPLRLWWPPDYLRLWYWAFFFPQAIRWYVREFGDSECRSGLVKGWFWITIRDDSIQRHLFVQSVLLVVSTGFGLQWGLVLLGAATGWLQVAAGTVIGALLGLVVGLQDRTQPKEQGGLSHSAGTILVFGTIFGAIFGLVFGDPFWTPLNAVSAILLIAFVPLTTIVAFAMSSLLVLNPMRSPIDGIVIRLSTSIVFAGIIGATAGILIGVVRGINAGSLSAVIVCLSFVMVGCRLVDWLIAWPITALSRGQYWGSHMSWLPIRKVQLLLEECLQADWRIGIENVRQVINYTSQFLTAVEALNFVLSRVPEDELLERFVELGRLIPDWDLLELGSVELTDHLRSSLTGTLLSLLPGFQKTHDNCSRPRPRLDTPARIVCAGFWYWHLGETSRAADAFAKITHLRHGEELGRIAQAIVMGREASSLEKAMTWPDETAFLETLPNPELRPGSLQVLLRLRAIGDAMRVASSALSPLNRSLAIRRASVRLDRLINTGREICGEPEWQLILGIALKWREIITEAGGVLSEDVLRQPVVNPYEGYSGLPVIGSTFVGRDDILREIETRWATGGRLPPLIIFGHRRMGKSSILRNLGRRADSDTILVYLDMQDAGWVDHTGQLLLDFAEAIHRKAGEADLDAGPAPTSRDYADLGTARRALNTLLDRLDGQMAGRRLILAVDEYEIIETGIQDGRIDAAIPNYLRSKTSQYPWLALIFAGLHTLDEMSHDYRSAFWGAAEHVRVGYMSHDDAIRLITQPHPDFTLEYATELREELVLLTYGQPYLLQRLCWELVNRWNDRFLKEGGVTPRILTLDDLAPILTPDFYQAAGYYFDGVWRNITEAERQLLRIIAGQTNKTWTPDELAGTTGQSESTVRPALHLLRRHDVIMDEAGGVRFAAELMRRWVAEYGGSMIANQPDFPNPSAWDAR
jgi:hypothetical protein